MCHQIFAARFHLKDHLIKLSKDKKPRCPGLKTVIPSDVWTKECIPYYTMDGPKPDLSAYTKSSTRCGRPRVDFTHIKRRDNKKRRLSESGEVDSQAGVRLSQEELLELLHSVGDSDMKWLVGMVSKKGGCADLRKVYTVAKRSEPPKPLAPRDALALQAQLFLGQRGYKLLRAKIHKCSGKVWSRGFFISPCRI